MLIRGQFSINPSLDGNLSFKFAAQLRKPEGPPGEGAAAAADNVYHVAVQAVAADPVTAPATEDAITTRLPQNHGDSDRCERASGVLRGSVHPAH